MDDDLGGADRPQQSAGVGHVGQRTRRWTTWPRPASTEGAGPSWPGVELSEGQWQRTALARASMRADPLLFVLDEPTASLDAPTEHHIFQRHLARSRELAARTAAITVIVSHRFSTVAGADHILVLHHGRVVEQGNHQELLAYGGRYADLYGIQAIAYAQSGDS